MEKLKKIPVIGYILRVIIAVCKLPKHIDNLYQVLGDHREDNLEAIKRLQEQNDKLQMQCEEALRENQTLQVQCDELKRWNADRMQEIAGLQNVVDKNVDELKRWNADRMQEIRNHGEIIKDLYNLKELNRKCSEHPTIWGNESKLHISNLASVNTCLFNTNSGYITIGDYTFSGSGVSILAGSHDMRLTGLLRRDCELKEGCDITIGKGVWLASNCTILGPAVIEDNAVVAAGAVVTPGTHVPANTVYGGIPACKIADIKCCSDNDWEADAYKKALRRANGILFVDGWTEKRTLIYKGQAHVGHYLADKDARILVRRKKVELCYLNESDNQSVLNIVDMGKKDRIEHYIINNKYGEITIELCEQTELAFHVNIDKFNSIFIWEKEEL